MKCSKQKHLRKSLVITTKKMKALGGKNFVLFFLNSHFVVFSTFDANSYLEPKNGQIFVDSSDQHRIDLKCVGVTSWS